MTSSTIDTFRTFMQQRQKVAQAYVTGDPAPLGRISTTEDPATFFGPGGGYEKGAKRVLSVNEAGARQFEPGGESRLEIFHMAAGEELAYWVGIQHADVRVKGKEQATPMSLRVTEVFRREDDHWKLIHRHADTLVDAGSG